MTIIEAINRIDTLISNTYAQEEKLQWLDNLDRRVKLQVVDTHEGGETVAFSGYGEDTDLHTQLLAPAPFDEMYLRWLEAQIHYYNGEFERYNIAITMFNNAFADYARHYNRTHMPLANGRRFVF